ncbi:peptidoglycan D,D-transpeptidase FtsI family protein [Alkalibacter saccharofermentans]|uniref:Peptidoglycan glycosyltransferase n=1 Tax=Alkalibacter saccharofermentans DSM 14828 TaxID=1120975 RepID=A0A1M4SC90_9FIRM|nr:penicillin-binding protein 2 [Alkalibacter saccharofermentans]SHE29820.1 peptidoglycan glycosyltransferase [Alkalibacter saccharofermentans DSM 14828]
MKENKKALRVLAIVCILFLSLIGYLTYFEIFLKESVVANSYNKRQWEYANNKLRGSIFDRDGETLAYSEGEGTDQVRIYPHNGLYSHVIGYHSIIYGNSFLESVYQKELSGNTPLGNVLDIKNKLTGEDGFGNNLHLTIDHDLQRKALNLLKGRNGAIVAVNPKTGEILAMAGNPIFNPNESNLVKNWSSMLESQDSPFLSRSLQGLYAPGSTFKLVTAAAALENGYENYTFEDSGSVAIDGMTIRNSGSRAYGALDITKAFSLSSNTYFATLGVELGESIMKSGAENFGLNKNLPFNLSVRQSTFPYKKMAQTELAASAIGQGQILVTPIQMAMAASAIANDGVMMEPYLVSNITDINRNILFSATPKEYSTSVSIQTAEKLTDMMVEAVNSGTGKNAKISGVLTAGKTGTAQNEKSSSEGGNEHAWFMGFAPADDPQIAVAVILEYSGSSGGSAAAPIAKSVMEAWLK